MNVINIGPQPGPQTTFLETPADIAWYGGAAGGGKTYSLLLDPLYGYNTRGYSATIFRRNTTQIRNQGGLWDESMGLYRLLHAEPRNHDLSWQFTTGMRMKFAHLEHDDTVYDYQGAQIPWIGYDELPHFTRKQFVYMMSRNRSVTGEPGKIRATMNADADSWVRPVVDWYINPETGLAIPERSGVVRYFATYEEEFIWGNSKSEITDRYPDLDPLSFTFIPSLIYDNKILMQKDPKYLSKLKSLSRVERERLLGGNWNIRATAGNYFRREWFTVIDAIPAGWIQSIRFWDRAATKPHEGNRDPDWTRGLKLYKYPNGKFVIVDLKGDRNTPAKIEELIKATASHDGSAVRITSQQDPGSAGVAEAHHFVSMLSGYQVSTVVYNKDKETRARPVSAQCEVGNIQVLRADWNNVLFSELENFPEGAHDDIVDVLSGAFNELSGGASIADVL